MYKGDLPPSHETRRSSRVGKGVGGQLAQMKNLERMQTTESRPRRLNAMDVATEEQEVNPMAPTQPQLPAAPKLRPKPKVIIKSTTVDSSQLPPSPAFSLVVPGQQFGFRMPPTSGSRQSQHGSHRTPDLSSNTSGPPSSHTGSMGFSALSCGTSTAPTSRAPSVSSRGDFDPDKRVNHASQPVSGHSSHLRMLALASLTSQAPPCASRVQPGSAVLSRVPHTSQSSPLDSNAYSQEDHRLTHPQLGVQPAAQDLFNDKLGSPPPRPVGLRRTTSFYNQPLVVQPGHSIYETPDVEQDDDPLIGETSPSDDERSAEAVIHNGSHPAMQGQPYLNEGGMQVPDIEAREDGDGIENTVAVHPQFNRAHRPPCEAQPVGHEYGAEDAAHHQHNDAPHPPQPVGQVRDILERAKQFSHCDVASVNAFPLRAQFNGLAHEYVEEAIRERRSRGLFVPDGWWPHYSNNIYKLGHTNNLVHPALSGLIIDFFYTTSSSVGKLFPEVFGEEVPRVTIVLAATTIKVVLDEMVAGQSKVSFQVGTYMPIYLEILGLMNKCDTSPIHAEKMKSLRVKWATSRNGATDPEVILTTAGFDVNLD
ncbi:hypothetical protein BDN67DRAFT_1013903 [Paxillus ammoniavirescens]|nr:hypothetical protein BDN67DRAFT_1013903 [Paxillus ammoniavirescens]